jgi:signal transduction histidine kinase
LFTDTEIRPALEAAAAEEQAAHYERLGEHLEQVAQVAGRLAHDFSNVLTGILGFSELALNQMPADSTSRRYIRESWESAQRGAEWIQKLHLFCRRGPTQPPPTPLGPVVLAEQARLAPAWAPAVTLRAEVPDELPPVAVAPELLRRVLAELLDNARQAVTGAGGVTLSARLRSLDATSCRLLLGAASPGPHVEIAVRDTGCGLSQERLNAFLASLLVRGKPRQGGLGLAVVYGIVRAHRGGLYLKPVPPPGTHLCVCLPVAPPLG